MAGHGWNFWKWPEMSGMAGHGCKWLEWMEMDVNCWELVKIGGNGWNG